MPRQAYKGGLSDIEIALSTGATCSILYIALSVLLKGSQVPLLVAVFLASNMLSRTNLVQAFKPRIYDAVARVLGNPAFLTGVIAPSSVPKTKGEGYDKFAALSETSKVELLSAIKSLQAYSSNAKSTNERRRKLFKLMSWRQQKLCEDVGYLKKLKRIDQSTQVNQQFLNRIVDHSVKSYGLSFSDFDLLKSNSATSQTSSSNYRVIESLSHYIRDWSPVGDEETRPMMNYIFDNLNAIISPQNRSKTCVIVPGSGLGKIAHSIAALGENNQKFGAVHAVEYSGLMHLCNSFIYSGDKDSKEKNQIFSGVHTCSNYYTTESQFRSTSIELFPSQPDNLTIHLDDFRYFSVPNISEYENVVIVSAFFVDTAENLIDYFDTIHSLTTPSRSNKIKNGYWINVGPLKYGSAAQVELNSGEVEQVRKAMGWKDLNTVNSLKDTPPNTEKGLVGYVTDKESMWQGYYGLTMWTSARKENKKA